MTITNLQLTTLFLYNTENEIDNHNPFGSDLKKVYSKELEHNMKLVTYMLSKIQYFEVFIDKETQNKVVSQNTFFPNVDSIYEVLKRNALPKKLDFTDGFIINIQGSEVLFELISYPDRPLCIKTSTEEIY